MSLNTSGTLALAHEYTLIAVNIVFKAKEAFLKLLKS